MSFASTRISFFHFSIAYHGIDSAARIVRFVIAVGQWSVTPPWPQKLLGVGPPVSTVEFSLDGECLACGCHDDGTGRLWNGRNGSCTLLEGRTQFFRGASFSPEWKILASACQDQSIHLWKLDDQSHFWKVTSKE
jgi:WD40 repeat protein